MDYTSMIAGDVDEEVAEKVRKTRREKKHNKLCGWRGGVTRSNYRAILKNSAPVSEAMKKEKEAHAPAAAPVAPAVPVVPTAAPAAAPAAPVSEKKSEKKKSERKVNEKKVNEKKTKKADEDGWVTIEKKH